MKLSAIGSISPHIKTKTNSSAESRAELTSKIVQLLSKTVATNEKALLSALLSDPASLTRLVRHAGLSQALDKALQLESVIERKSVPQTSPLLPDELTQILLKAKPTAFGSGEPYGAGLNLDEASPFNQTDENQKANNDQGRYPPDWHVATPFSPSRSDYERTIDYFIERNPSSFNPSIFGTQQSRSEERSIRAPSIFIALFLICTVAFVVIAIIFSRF